MYFLATENTPLAHPLTEVLEVKAAVVAGEYIRQIQESRDTEKTKSLLQDVVRANLSQVLSNQAFAEAVFEDVLARVERRLANVRTALESVMPHAPEEKKPDLDLVLAKKISDMGLSVRTMNALEFGGIQTLQDLVLQSGYTIMMIRNLGELGWMEILQKLAEFRLTTGYASVDQIKVARMEEKQDDENIESLSFSAYARRALSALRVRTFKDVRALTIDALVALPGCGSRTIMELCETFGKANVFLAKSKAS